MRCRLRVLAIGVRMPAFGVGVPPPLLACPTLVLPLGLDLLPDNRIVLRAGKRVPPPVGWAKELQELPLDRVYVLQPFFQGVLVLVSRAHVNHNLLQRNAADIPTYAASAWVSDLRWSEACSMALSGS